ncbi:hypothetical protein MTZ49_04685 [Entomomonas sp. E2T0]|uniref:hypothetical protein n=1 Tax=Entomomonas sp. E2T0 TaxID=2930213 RepID=UPI00222826A7|nr:hypothetical protein [Entomomonas sp. E2T0]UYZ84867.1 hypothetical protein MTZ49_04685 [Entomomonas sp. E2T0]
MSLLIKLYECPRSSIKPVASIEQCNALLNWFDNHLLELHSGAIVELTEQTLLKLLSDLYRISANSCEQVFPTIPQFVHGASEYDETYWQKVAQLRIKLKQLLDTFDFNQHRLFLQGNW